MAVNAPCDVKWRRLRADVTAPEGATGVYPEFGFAFTDDSASARFVEVDRLGLVPLGP